MSPAASINCRFFCATGRIPGSSLGERGGAPPGTRGSPATRRSPRRRLRAPATCLNGLSSPELRLAQRPARRSTMISSCAMTASAQRDARGVGTARTGASRASCDHPWWGRVAGRRPTRRRRVASASCKRRGWLQTGDAAAAHRNSSTASSIAPSVAATRSSRGSGDDRLGLVHRPGGGRSRGSRRGAGSACLSVAEKSSSVTRSAINAR